VLQEIGGKEKEYVAEGANKGRYRRKAWRTRHAQRYKNIDKQMTNLP